MALNFPTWNMGYLTYPDVQEYLKQKDIVMVPVGQLRAALLSLSPAHRQHSLRGHHQNRGGVCPGPLHAPALGRVQPPPHGPAQFGSGHHHRAGGRTWRNMMYDICRSLIHHGFNKLILVVGHASNMKIIDPLMRSLKYDTGALIGICKPWAENYLGIVSDILEGPPEETPGMAFRGVGNLSGSGRERKMGSHGAGDQERGHQDSALSAQELPKKGWHSERGVEGYQYSYSPWNTGSSRIPV